MFGGRNQIGDPQFEFQNRSSRLFVVGSQRIRHQRQDTVFGKNSQLPIHMRIVDFGVLIEIVIAGINNIAIFCFNGNPQTFRYIVRHIEKANLYIRKRKTVLEETV